MSELCLTEKLPWSQKNLLLREQKGIAHSANVIRFLSKNLQANRNFHCWTSLLDHDILLLQEVKLTAPVLPNEEVFKDFTTTLPTDHASLFGQRAGVFARKSKFKCLGINSFSKSLPLDVQTRVADLLVKAVDTNEIWLVISVYLPCQRYELQTADLEHIRWRFLSFAIEVSPKHKKFSILWGGDFNSTTDDTLDSAKALVKVALLAAQDTRRAIQIILDEQNLTDCFRYLFPDVQHYTNRGAANHRRLDRMYVTTSTLGRLYDFGERLESLLRSSHVTLHMKFLLDPACRTTVGPNRFIVNTELLRDEKLVLRFMPGAFFGDWDKISADCASLMKLADYEWRHRQKTGDTYVNAIKQLRHTQFHANQSLVFKGNTKSARILRELVSADGTRKAHDTAGLHKIALRFWRSQVAKPRPTNYQSTIRYLEKWPVDASALDLGKLEAPFTEDELLRALRCTKNGAPGEDGLTYPFWKAAWPAVAPHLTEAANDLMKGKPLPKRFSKVLITLIQKKGRAVNIKDFRPISLLNTSLRIICHAISRRLMPIADAIVGPHQKGFIANRRVEDNITQFRIAVAALGTAPKYNARSFKAPFEHVPEWEQAEIVMIDFQKAFDSVSHDYIELVLHHIGIPVRFQLAIMTILRGVTAHLWINRTEGAPFPLDRGTQQGNPFSPLLFALAVEPLLAELSTRLRGIKITHKFGWSTMIRLTAYADDLTCYLGCEEDAKILKGALAAFCAASNSLVNASKSEVFHSRTEAQPNVHPVLGYPQKRLSTATIKYLGIETESKTWDVSVRDVVGILRQTAISSLPLAHRAQGVNTFVLLRIYYRDVHDPMPINNQNYLMHEVQRAFFQGTGVEKVFSRIESGGFGCLDLNLQLLGRRGKIIWDVFHDTTQWHFALFRVKIQFWLLTKAMNVGCYLALPPDAGRDFQPRQLQVSIQPWWSFLLGQKWKFHHTERNYINIEAHVVFTKAEQKFLKAWFTIVMPLYHPTGKTAPTSVDDYPLGPTVRGTQQELLDMAIKGALPDPLPAPFNRKEFSVTLFNSYCKKTQLANPVDCTSETIRLLAPDSNFKKFWLDLKKLIFGLDAHFTYLHLFHLGGDVPRIMQGDFCAFCKAPMAPSPDKDKVARASHLYFECPVSTMLWHAAGLDGHPLRALVIGSVHFDSAKVDLFLYYVKFLLNSRRRSARGLTRNAQTGALVSLDTDPVLELPDLQKKDVLSHLRYFDTMFNVRF